MHRLCLAVVFLTACGVAPGDAGVSRARLVAATPSTPPRVMLLLDTSGSMSLPLDPTDAACPAGCGLTAAVPCPSTCATRISAARAALDAFLTSVPAARIGLTHYPADMTCGAPDGVDVPIPSSSTDLDAVRTHVQALIPRGGTPTAAALEFVGALPSLQPSADGSPAVVVLVTDGLPNCNEQNPANACGASSTCTCTLGSCSGAMCAMGCLDADHTSSVLAGLRARGIEAAVVPFGPETSEGAFESMARSTRRPAPHAQNAVELERRLSDTLAAFAPVACSFTLAEALQATERLEVHLGARLAAADEWEWLDARRVRLLGSCDETVSFSATPAP